MLNKDNFNFINYMIDIKDFIDLAKIRSLLIREPDLLCLFEIVVIFINNTINKETKS